MALFYVCSKTHTYRTVLSGGRGNRRASASGCELKLETSDGRGRRGTAVKHVLIERILGGQGVRSREESSGAAASGIIELKSLAYKLPKYV